MSTFNTTAKKVLVVGATGATGKHVVQMLLDQGQTVVAVARSQEKMKSRLQQKDYGGKLIVKELSLLDISPQQFQELTTDCDAVVSCLGHNLTFRGMYKDGYFVTSVTKSLCKAMPAGCRFIMMGSDGVANPDGSDPKRAFSERCVLFLLRWLVPPHADNEMAALHLHKNRDQVDWTVVRPTDLIDAEVSDYDIFDNSTGSLFGAGTATRANVAHMMVRLVTDDTIWKKYKHMMPVLFDKAKPKENVNANANTSSGVKKSK